MSNNINTTVNGLESANGTHKVISVEKI